MHWGWALSCLRNGALGGPDSFGTAGSAASRAWANPELGLAFAYTPNLCSLGHFDAREAALSRAVIRSATDLIRPLANVRRPNEP